LTRKASAIIFSFLVLITSCSSYKQNIMFSLPENYSAPDVFKKTESTYVIQPFDLLELKVYANAGETIVDPLEQSEKEAAGEEKTIQYLVDANGAVKFPLIEEFKAAGLTLRDAEQLLEKEYGKFYKQPFVKLKYANKRVVVLGSPVGEVVQLTNENVRLTEVLALAKSVDNQAKVHNIRVLRGDKVFVADLSTLEGYQKDNIMIEPNDIIYVEPVRKPLQESFREAVPFITVLSSLATLVFLITRSQ